MFFCVLFLCVVTCYAQKAPELENATTSLRNGLTEHIGNFSLEFLFHTAKLQPGGQNMIVSPFTVWTVLAVISEGASGRTKAEINNAIRLPSRNLNSTRRGYGEIAQWLRVNTTTVVLAKFNGIFVDRDSLPHSEFRETVKKEYDTDMVFVNFKDKVNSANYLNAAVSNFTHGRIPHIVESSYFQDTHMILTSALYFKGQWTVPFNTSNTMKQPFFDSNGKQIGEVNMMYNRHTFPFANIKELKARVIELPYGIENRLSMLIMLPNPGVSLEDMFVNFQNLTLDRFFEQLRLSKEEFSDDEVDCFIPRFKIESNIDLADVLQSRMGIKDLFDMKEARLPFMARTPVYVSKIVHKAEIEVTEEGTAASAVTIAEFSNRIGVVRFEASRPFTYMIIEKVTNSIVFGGFYKQPTLY